MCVWLHRTQFSGKGVIRALNDHRANRSWLPGCAWKLGSGTQRLERESQSHRGNDWPDRSAVWVAYPALSEVKVFVCSNVKQGTCWIFVFVFFMALVEFPWFSKLFDSLCFSETLGNIYGPNSPGGNSTPVPTASPCSPSLIPSTMKLPICTYLCWGNWKSGVIIAASERLTQETSETVFP